MNIEELIIKYKLNQTALAGIIGVKQVTFNEKVRKSRHSKFTADQQDKLKAHFTELAEDIRRLK